MKKSKKTESTLILNHLEELAAKLGVKLRYENLKDPSFYIEGGSCRIGEDFHIIIHSKLTVDDKIEIIGRELKKFPLEGVFLTPLLRKALFGGIID